MIIKLLDVGLLDDKENLSLEGRYFNLHSLVNFIPASEKNDAVIATFGNDTWLVMMPLEDFMKLVNLPE